MKTKLAGQKIDYDVSAHRTCNDAQTPVFKREKLMLWESVPKQHATSTSTCHIQFALYEAYGTRPYEWGTDPDNYKANTKYEEFDLNMVDDGMRWRDLETGSYLTRDPIGYADGPNVYCYVHCNPITHFDAFGLYDEDDAVDRGNEDFGSEDFQDQFDDAGDYDNFEDWFNAEGNKDKWYDHLADQGHNIFNNDYTEQLREANAEAQQKLFSESAADRTKETLELMAYHGVGDVDRGRVDEYKGVIDNYYTEYKPADGPGYWERFNDHYQQELGKHGEVLTWAQDLSVFGWLSIGASLNEMFTSEMALDFIKNAPTEGAWRGGNISQRMVNGASAAKAARRVSVGRTALGGVGKVTGGIGAASTGYTVGAHIISAGRAIPEAFKE